MPARTIGTIILVEHSGAPTAWPVTESETKPDHVQLRDMFESARAMCESELLLGGCLKLVDAQNNLVDETRTPA